MTGRKHIESQPVDMTEGWQTPPGFPSGMVAKVLSGNLDEERKTGSRTRLMRFQPGACGAEAIVHEFREGVCWLRCIWHGPFKSETGCLLLEIHYFDPAEAR